MISLFSSRKRFAELSEKEVLALAISNEEDDSRIYASYAARLRGDYPATAKIFDAMVEEEDQHRRQLIDEFQRRFDGPIPLIRREHVAGYFPRRPIWPVENPDLDRLRRPRLMPMPALRVPRRPGVPGRPLRGQPTGRAIRRRWWTRRTWTSSARAASARRASGCGRRSSSAFPSC